VKTFSVKPDDVTAHGNDSWGGPYGPSVRPFTSCIPG
jgi:hypothetical protein